MGALLSLFTRSELESFEPDFDNCQPLPIDEKLYAECEACLAESHEILELLETYEVATSAIKRAIEDPDAESECFAEVLPNIVSLGRFWQFSQTLGDLVERILLKLSDENNEYVFSQQALSKQYAEIISFVIEWDFRKMIKSNLQNDLAFYRRCMDRQAQEHDLPVSQDHTAYISMMLAEALPMFKAISTKLKQRVQRGNRSLGLTVARFTEACRFLIENRKFEDESPYYELCLRAMAGSFVIYDQISIEGAFRTKNMRSKKIIVHVCNIWPNMFPNNSEANSQLKNLILYGAPRAQDQLSSKQQAMLGS